MSTIYVLPPGAHSVSARGKEFVGDEHNRIDLKDVDTGTLHDLVHLAHVKLAPTDEEIAISAADAEAYATYKREAAAASLQAREKHDAELAAEARVKEMVAATEEAAREHAALETKKLVKIKATTPVAMQSVPQPADEQNTPGSDSVPGSRSVTPPRRKKPSEG